MHSLNRKISRALAVLAVLAVSPAASGQDRFSPSDVRGKWYGDDGRTYTFQAMSGNKVTLKIEGRETRARPSVSPSMDEGLVQIMTGPESILHSQYLGSFSAPSFQVSKRLDTVEEYQPGAVSPPILQQVFKDHSGFSSRIDIRIIDKARLEITRHVTSVSTRSSELSGVNEKAETETASLARTRPAKRMEVAADGREQSGDTPKKPDEIAADERSQDSENKDEPDVLVCFSDGRYVKVRNGAPCARPAQKQLADIDRTIRALRNLISKYADPDSEAVRSARADVSRLRKDKAQLLEAIDGKTEELHVARKQPGPSGTMKDLTRTTSVELGNGGVREETKDDNGLVELAREYRKDGSVSYEKSVKQKYRNGRPAQVWEAYYPPESQEIQGDIEIVYFDPDGNRLGKTNMVIWRDRPAEKSVRYEFWKWDESREAWSPAEKPVVGF